MNGLWIQPTCNHLGNLATVQDAKIADLGVSHVILPTPDAAGGIEAPGGCSSPGPLKEKGAAEGRV